MAMDTFFSRMDKDANICTSVALFSKSGCHSVYGLGGSVKTSFTARGIEKRHASALIIVPNKEALQDWKMDLSFFAPSYPVYEFPLIDRAVFTTTAKSMDRSARAMEALVALRQDTPCIVVATIDEVAQLIVSPQALDEGAVSLRVDDEVDRQQLIERLVSGGYERVDMVERRGHFSIRGDIVDIFAVNYEQPLRLAFFGDALESLRAFDAISQKSSEELDHVRILPYAMENQKKETATILDYMEDGVIIWDEPNRCREEMKKVLKESPEYKEWLTSWRSLVSETRDTTEIVLSLMAQAVPDMVIQSSASFPAKAMASFQKQFELLRDELHHWQDTDNAIVIVIGNTQREASFRSWLDLNEFSYEYFDDKKTLESNMIYLAEGEIRNGFELPYAKLVILAERDIYGMQKRRLRHKAVKGQEINVFTDLKVGDYVVHEVHGIGRYDGIKTIEIDGVHKDYLQIHYAGKDILYVPTDQLNLIQRYIGNEGDIPKLQKMGGADWQKARKKAQKSIDNIAEKLVAVYAKREIVQGFAFPPDTPFQKEFEDAFPYEETEDQLKAIAAIKKSMEKPFPMDCLVCGDVGFGKTEVAMRAVFKAVMGGKQVAVLVPTTVLAQQHYQTFRERFENFGVRVEVLNRFRSPKEKKQILQGILTGDIDVLIGTHSILNKRVKFKDIGLLVVDEEQRFGVAQKEKWKSWAATIDVLTLSATPIPRTLHMSLVNLRQMCIIETPPTDRFPVQTYVTEYDTRIVRDAVMREKRRGGQVFFVYNHVASIERMKDELQALMPDITIGIAHGQMPGALLEEVMFEFYEDRYDVLLCSSLVENGLDVANANTIIIYDADHFGLSQLYQMRGRVGRSHCMAYAYFLYRRDKVLSEVAEKRLQAIKEFTELGSGFKIAMRDLEIRGAGNLLGREQHGNIASIGFAMYCSMLEKAIKKAQNGEEDVVAPPETVMETHIDAFIDDDYIHNGGQKIEMYQRMAVLQSVQELDELQKELIDRYGKPTKPVETLLEATRIRLRGKAMGLVLIAQKKTTLELKWQNLHGMPPLAKLAPALRQRLRLVPGSPTMVRVMLAPKDSEHILSLLKDLFKAFESLRKEKPLD